MKKNLFFLSAALLLANIQANAQYTLIHSDACGDGMFVDIKTISYKVNYAQDSIWFKIEACAPLGNDFGIMIGIDTNLNPMDGVAWDGMNQSLKYDHAIFASGTLMTPGVYYLDIGKPSMNTPLPGQITRPDNMTFIIRTKLSSIDQNKHFNLIVGGGSFDIASTGETYDDAPNSNYLTISPTPSSVQSIRRESISSLYPNPAENIINIGTPSVVNGQLTIWDVSGKKTLELEVKSSNTMVNTENLSPGVYTYDLNDEQSEIYDKGKFIKK